MEPASLTAASVENSRQEVYFCSNLHYFIISSMFSSTEDPSFRDAYVYVSVVQRVKTSPSASATARLNIRSSSDIQRDNYATKHLWGSQLPWRTKHCHHHTEFVKPTCQKANQNGTESHVNYKTNYLAPANQGKVNEKLSRLEGGQLSESEIVSTLGNLTQPNLVLLVYHFTHTYIKSSRKKKKSPVHCPL